MNKECYEDGYPWPCGVAAATTYALTAAPPYGDSTPGDFLVEAVAPTDTLSPPCILSPGCTAVLIAEEEHQLQEIRDQLASLLALRNERAEALGCLRVEAQVATEAYELALAASGGSHKLAGPLLGLV